MMDPKQPREKGRHRVRLSSNHPVCRNYVLYVILLSLGLFDSAAAQGTDYTQPGLKVCRVFHALSTPPPTPSAKQLSSPRR